MYIPTVRTSGQGSERQQRQFQILTVLDDAASLVYSPNAGPSGWITTGGIAKTMGMSKSPHFLAMLYEMVAEDWIERRVVTWRKNAIAHEYHIVFRVRWSSRWGKAFDAYYGIELEQADLNNSRGD